MNDLERWSARPTTLIPTRDEKEHRREMLHVHHEARETALKVDAAAVLVTRSMQRATDVDNQRKILAGDDPTLNAMLMRLEVNFLAAAERRLQEISSGFQL